MNSTNDPEIGNSQLADTNDPFILTTLDIMKALVLAFDSFDGNKRREKENPIMRIPLKLIC